jgi:hypothetical protein
LNPSARETPGVRPESCISDMGTIHVKETSREIALRNAPRALPDLIKGLSDTAGRIAEPVMLGLLLRAVEVLQACDETVKALQNRELAAYFVTANVDQLGPSSIDELLAILIANGREISKLRDAIGAIRSEMTDAQKKVDTDFPGCDFCVEETDNFRDDLGVKLSRIVSICDAMGVRS